MSPKGLFNGLETSTTTVAFPNLKELTIKDMKHWKDWVMETLSEVAVMPRLRDLHIYDCPMLKSVPHQILSQSVRTLFIQNCPKLTISCLPLLLEELILDGDAGSLSRSLPFKNNASLKVLYIQYSPHSTLPQGLSQLKALQTLNIVECNSLMCISNELQHLTSLREFYITRCPILGPRCDMVCDYQVSVWQKIKKLIRCFNSHCYARYDTFLYEFGFVVLGHEFDNYLKQKIRDIKSWDWFLEELKKNNNGDEDEDEDEEVSERKRSRNKKGVTRKKQEEANDDEYWTGKSEDDKPDVAKVRTNKRPKYTTRSKGFKKPAKNQTPHSSVDEEEEDDVDEDTLGGFIVTDEEVEDENTDEENEEEEEEEDFDEYKE
ncbi:hypothetical protein GIB67_005914 [Kingdonia uniflora]|uniref:Uncharacterized protein n=1 Tax=Kingdonia uniflora TaxID=39325 RepID=A0A7J7MBU6_9MAGN|nr:hypothetical protein GIB67_005914 [Kingdonia uniflora]